MRRRAVRLAAHWETGFVAVAAGLAVAVVGPGRLLALPENLLEMPNFREEHVAHRSSLVAVCIMVIRPEVVGQQLIRLGVESLEVE